MFEAPNRTEKLDLMSPVGVLPDPSEFEDDGGKAPPLRQSPASALPPMSVEDQEVIFGNPSEVTKEGCGEEYLPINPDIERPSPPRMGTLERNRKSQKHPFELSDAESQPVDLEKTLSPSHVFEATSLEQSLLLEGNEGSPGSGKSDFDSGTFVVRRSSSSLSSRSVQASVKSSQSSSPCSALESLKTNIMEYHSSDDGSLEGQRLFESKEEESIALGMDYDNLMAYFDNLKESSA